MAGNRMSVSLPPDVESLLDGIAEREHISKSEAIRRAFSLLKVAEQEKAKGNELAVVHHEGKGQYSVVARLVGI